MRSSKAAAARDASHHMKKGCLKAALFFSSRPAIQRSQTITRAGMAKRQTHSMAYSRLEFRSSIYSYTS